LASGRSRQQLGVREIASAFLVDVAAIAQSLPVPTLRFNAVVQSPSTASCAVKLDQCARAARNCQPRALPASARGGHPGFAHASLQSFAERPAPQRHVDYPDDFALIKWLCQKIIAPQVENFGPEALVGQTGCDDERGHFCDFRRCEEISPASVGQIAVTHYQRGLLEVLNRLTLLPVERRRRFAAESAEHASQVSVLFGERANDQNQHSSVHRSRRNGTVQRSVHYFTQCAHGKRLAKNPKTSTGGLRLRSIGAGHQQYAEPRP